MGVMDKFLNYMKLNDSDDDEEFDDEDDYEDDDDYEDEPEPRRRDRREREEDEDVPAPVKKPTKVAPFQKTAVARRNTGNSNGMNVCVIKPTSFDETKEITDTLLENQTVVLNLEGLNINLAQRIIDYTSGSCYAIKGKMQKVSEFIFIVTPKSVDISGDIEGLIDGDDDGRY